MASNDRQWVAYLKSHTRSYSDFLEWVGEEREKIHLRYKSAKDWGEVKELAGQEKTLDTLINLFIIADREERQQREHERLNLGS